MAAARARQQCPASLTAIEHMIGPTLLPRFLSRPRFTRLRFWGDNAFCRVTKYFRMSVHRLVLFLLPLFFDNGARTAFRSLHRNWFAQFPLEMSQKPELLRKQRSSFLQYSSRMQRIIVGTVELTLIVLRPSIDLDPTRGASKWIYNSLVSSSLRMCVYLAPMCFPVLVPACVNECVCVCMPRA